MSTDHELLDLAAKAAGINVWWGTGFQSDFLFRAADTHDSNGVVTGIAWNPLTDDGDAMRLSVKLGLDICRPNGFSGQLFVWVYHKSGVIEEKTGNDPYAATRRAIVRAAAEIGAALAKREG